MKIGRILDIISLYKNWYTVLLGRVDIVKNFKLKLRNGVVVKVRDSLDRSSISDIFGRQVWTKFRKIKDGDVVIDIGAFIGGLSLLAATSEKDVKVFAYEPFKESFEYLRDNILLNNLESEIMPINLAVTADGKPQKLYVGPQSTANSSYKIEGLSDAMVIESVRLEDVFETNKIEYCDFLKMNCEGSEYDIILTAPKEILRKIGYIAIEYHWINGREEKDLEKILNVLKNSGFKVEQQIKRKSGGYLFVEKINE
jgi:FkbM family methyltransferase